jgi:hypothetical protein
MALKRKIDFLDSPAFRLFPELGLGSAMGATVKRELRTIRHFFSPC